MNIAKIVPFTLYLMLGFVAMVALCSCFSQAGANLQQPSWRGITPGQTSLSEALAILGDPDTHETRNDYQVYCYLDRKDSGWKKVELWVTEQHVVIGIYRVWPLCGEGGADVQNLDPLVTAYGRPDDVTWTPWCFYRTLIWARWGVAAASSAERQTEWSSYGVAWVLTTEPMPIAEWLRTDWPWPSDGMSPASRNHCSPADTDAPDTYLEDPYDWSKVPPLERTP